MKKEPVEVAFVVVAFTPVKFWRVVDPRSCTLPLESTSTNEVVAFEPTFPSIENSGMLELVEVAEILKRASGEVVPIPIFPVVALAEMRELKVRPVAPDQMARVLAEPVPVRLEPPTQVLFTLKHPVATLIPPLKVEVPAPVALI